MKTKKQWLLSGTALLCTLFAGCSPESGPRSDAGEPSPSEVQGQPIQRIAKNTGEPAPEPVAEAPATASAEPVPSEPAPVAAAAPVAVESEVETIRSGDQEYFAVGFDQLASFNFEMTDDLLEAKGDPAEITEKTNGQIPPKIRAFDQKAVAVKGYMLPLKVEKGAVTEFLIMRDQSMCCFGTVPKINEWVSVKTVGKGVKPIMDEPVTIFGKLHVGEMRENGYLVGIYRLEGEKLAGSLDL